MNGISLNNTSGAAITLANNNPMTWGGNNTFTGTNDLNLGTGAVTLTATRTWTVNGTLTVGGVIGDTGAGRGLTKQGSGTLVLSGASTYTGATTLGAGSLTLDFSSSIARQHRHHQFLQPTRVGHHIHGERANAVAERQGQHCGFPGFRQHQFRHGRCAGWRRQPHPALHFRRGW